MKRTSIADEKCVRCGKPYGELEFEINGPEGRINVPDSSDDWLFIVAGEPVCRGCMSLPERRREDYQCERCGVQFHDDGRDSDAGWITDQARFLCPRCQTAEEQRENEEDFIAGVRRGMELAEAEGREYPSDLEALAAALERQHRHLEADVDALNRAVEDEA